MPFIREFVWAEDEEFGIEGWKPKHMPEFNASIEALGIVHDTLEHLDPRDASLEAEMHAFGVMLYLRGEPEWWAQQGQSRADPAEQMHSDLGRFLMEAIWRGGTLARPRRTTRLDEWPEEIIANLDQSTRRFIRTEFGSGPAIEQAIALVPNIAGWLRIGYRQAAKRYRYEHTDERIHLFNTAMAAVAPLAKHGDWNDTLRVSVDIRTCQVQAKIIEYRDPYDY